MKKIKRKFLSAYTIILLVVVSILGACSTTSTEEISGSVTNNLLLKSNPQGAEVYIDEKFVGVTPLSLKKESLFDKNNQFVLVSLRKKFYRPIGIFVREKDFESYDVTLIKMNSEDFKQSILLDFEKEINQFSRSLLEAHGLLVVKDLKKAKIMIDRLISEYPNIAVLHTMLGNISFEEEDYQNARGHLLRAVALDPEDKSAIRMLGRIDQKLGISK